MDPVKNILSGKKVSKSDYTAYSLFKKPYNKLTQKEKDKVFEALEIWKMGKV